MGIFIIFKDRHGQDQIRFKRHLINATIFEMSYTQLPAFHFEIFLLFLSSVPCVPFYTSWKAEKIFSGVIKRKYWGEISEQEYQKKNRQFRI